MGKLPAFQFYPGDWRKDPGVQSLSFHDRGVWFEIICLMHESEQRGKLLLNGEAMPETALARLLGLDNQILTTTLTTLLTYGVASRCPDTGALTCRRMIRDENLRKIRTEAGKQGGNPLLVKQNPTTKVKQKSTPSSSITSSITSSDIKDSLDAPPLVLEIENPRVVSQQPLPFDSPAFAETWAKWKRHRSEIKKPLKPTMEAAQLDELKAMGESRAITALNHTISKGWQGIREPEAQLSFGGTPKPVKPTDQSDVNPANIRSL